MSPGYLLVIGDHMSDCEPVIQRITTCTGLTPAFANGRMTALVGPSCPCLNLGSDGAVLGNVFQRHGRAEAVRSFGPEEVAAIVAGEGRALLSSHWGGYVAAVARQESVTVMRDPSGNFPAYFLTTDRFTFVASDAEMLVKGGLVRASINYEEIGRQLYRAFVPVPSTALDGIHELLAGFRIRVPTRLFRQEQAWNPWDHVRPAEEDPAGLAEGLVRTIQHSVHAVTSPYDRVLVSVSGGLDSSIVVGCLGRAGGEALCLTMFTDDPAGDERVFARTLCEKFGLRLIERAYRIADVDLDEAIAPNLPRPKDRLQALAFERVRHAVAAETGAAAVLTGNGGDHVFGYSQSAAPIADRYLAEGLSKGTARSVIDVCRQTGCSLADAIRQAWSLAHHDRAYRVRPNPLFLHAAFVESLGPWDWHHPWLEAPPGALPGKAAHVATILRVQPNLEPSLGDSYPVLNPLVSQPVVEACLKIPTWSWREGGRDRALVRRAFADVLPSRVLDRRIKGTPGRFAARLLDHFRSAIRDRVLGGRLAAAGILDTVALGDILSGERPIPDLERVRILELVNVEVWAGHWLSRKSG